MYRRPPSQATSRKLRAQRDQRRSRDGKKRDPGVGFITDPAVIRWICTRWISSGWWAVQGDFKSPVTEYQTTICERCTEEHNRLFQAWITTDSIKIFSITCYTLVTVYCIFICEGERTIGHRWDEIDGNGGQVCIVHIGAQALEQVIHSERRFQNCALCCIFLHVTLRCSSFRFKTVICLRLCLLCRWDVQCCMQLKDSHLCTVNL